MTSPLEILGLITPIVLIVGLGALLRRVGWLEERADPILMRLVVNILLPSLIFSVILGNPALQKPGNLVLPPLIGFTGILLGYGLGGLGIRLLMPSRQPAEQRTFAFTVGIYNFGYFAIPLVLGLFGRETAGVLFVHNMGIDLALWGIGVP
ncbi:MAG: AEC family transporter, partial [Verrucomicrobiota bacterium]